MRYCRVRTEQGPEPVLIQEHPLTCCLPQRTNLLFLPTRRKDMVPCANFNEAFEALYLGITAATFPVLDCPLASLEQLSEFSLGHADACSPCMQPDTQ